MRSDVGAVRQTWIFLLQPALPEGRSRPRLIWRKRPDLVQCGAARGQALRADSSASIHGLEDRHDFVGALDRSRTGYAFDAVACLSAEVAHSSEIGDQAGARRVPSENFLRVRT